MQAVEGCLVRDSSGRLMQLAAAVLCCGAFYL